MTERHRVSLVLAVAVLAVSSSAILVRSIEADPLAIAFWRTLGAALLLAPGLRRVGLGDAARILLSGACLAGHFTAWFASLEATTVLRSTVLVSLGPAWTAILAWAFLGQRPDRQLYAGLAVALPGLALLATTSDGAATAWGDGLAALGGVLGAAYLVIGRSVRQRVGIASYASLVCAGAALCLLPTALLADAPLLGFTGHTWALLAGMTLGPQLLGHSGFNYALRALPAPTVAAAMLLEPVGATVLAALLLAELPTAGSALGGALVLAGVLVAVRRDGRELRAEPAS